MLKQKEKDTINNIGIPTQILLDTLTEVPWGIAITERKESTNNIIFINHAFENMIACEAKVVVGQDWQILLGKSRIFIYRQRSTKQHGMESIVQW